MTELQPISKSELIKDFRAMGVKAGMNLMLHSSLSKIGWVIGGAQTVVSALIDIIGKEGTIVMPAATPFCLHPNDWDEAKIRENWIPKIVEHLPVFDLNTTPTTMGAIPETFRNWPKTLRSDHPISSVSAWGKLSSEITKSHTLEISEGENTPYEKVYDLNFEILLLGVGFNRCTMLHFAESKSKNRRTTTSRYPIFRNTKRVWVEVEDMGNDNGTYFPKIGASYLKDRKASMGKIGMADSMLFSARTLVDYGTSYFDNMNI
ncbi:MULTISPECIES: aminoglycoside N(3)-acetyltransferase [Aquimarina]|uniref:aminoglycoside N(3)-acetyltransferase n=1 Tax=Aquimarina TaxID=290174 RepID=UPI00094364D4|nr:MULTISPECIES: AAC(3) family N-acetyltransferase [Aquimarina]